MEPCLPGSDCIYCISSLLDHFIRNFIVCMPLEAAGIISILYCYIEIWGSYFYSAFTFSFVFIYNFVRFLSR